MREPDRPPDDAGPARLQGWARSRRPGEVPDDAGDLDARPDEAGTDVRWGVDADGDGRSDTLLTDDGDDLLVHTDLDGDGLADRVLRIGPDGSVLREPQAAAGPAEVVEHDGQATGSAHAAWGGLLGRFGLGT